MATESLIGGYKLLSLMMTGQTSQVWEVTEPHSGRHFAMKMLLPEHVHAPEQRYFLFHEAEVGLKLQHPNVIRMLKLVKDKHNPYIVMEFFPSSNLKLRLMRRTEERNEFVKEKTHWILEQAAAGLGHINDRGWVHRDVKPDNILVNASGEVRIIDFALSQRISRGGMFGGLFRRRRATQGTRSYMSPEQIMGKPLDARADLYSFGATMYEVVTGRPPFRGSSPSDLLNRHLNEKPSTPKLINSEVTDDCAKLILRLLSKKKEERPRDFLDFLSLFRNIRVYESDPLEKPRMMGA